MTLHPGVGVWANYASWFKAGRPRRWLTHPLRALAHRRKTWRLGQVRREGNGRVVEAELFWGATMTVCLPEEVSSSLYTKGFFDEALTSALLALLKRGMTFVDVGAHYGYFSLLAAETVGTKGAVHAIEPTPSTFAVLRENLRQTPQAVCVNAAAYSSGQTLRLKDYGSAWSAFNSINKPRSSRLQEAPFEETDVVAISLDNYFTAHRVVPDVIKVDAESSELDVLRGLSQTLAGPRPVIAIEVGDVGSGESGTSRAIVDQLLSEGYEAYRWERGGFVLQSRHDRYKYDNLVFIPRERDREIG